MNLNFIPDIWIYMIIEFLKKHGKSALAGLSMWGFNSVLLKIMINTQGSGVVFYRLALIELVMYLVLLLALRGECIELTGVKSYKKYFKTAFMLHGLNVVTFVILLLVNHSVFAFSWGIGCICETIFSIGSVRGQNISKKGSVWVK